MSAYIVQNTTEAVAAPTPPVGVVYGFEMIYEGGRTRAWANTAEDLIDALIPGYLSLDAEDRLRARLRLALQVRATVQAEINTDTDLSGQPDGVIAALNAGVQAPQINVWSAPCPLVVLDLHYLPHTNIAPPVVTGPGVLLWFLAYDEDDFLTSLHQAQFVVLNRRDV